MVVRIYRDWKWVTIKETNPRLGGGPPPMECVPVDVLQYRDHLDQWHPVPIVEAPKPEDPRLAQERARREEHSQSLLADPKIRNLMMQATQVNKEIKPE